MPRSVNVGILEAFLGLNDEAFNASLLRARSSMRKAGRAMQRTGSQMTRQVSLPLLALGVASVKMATDFERSMSKIEGQVGIARSVVQGMKKDVLALSGPTGRAPQELADALFFVTSAGLRGADALEVLRLSARGAAAGFGETKIVADLVTSATNAYGIANLSAAMAMDTLAAAVREGKSEALDIAGAMGQVLPIASNLGVSFQEVGASIAAMSRTGTLARTAVIQLRQILASLLKPSAASEAAFEAMGTSSAALRDTLAGDQGLLKVLSFFREEMDEDSQAMAKAFPNIRALSGALDIMGKNADENVGIFSRMTNNVGDADRAFDAAANTASFKFNQALAELKIAAINLGNVLMPLFLGLARVIKNAATGFTSLSEESRRFWIVLGLIGVGLGPAIFLIGKLTVAMSGLLVVFRATAITIATITIPVWAVVAAVIALAAALVFVVDNWKAFKERLSNWDWLKEFVINMTQFFVVKLRIMFSDTLAIFNKFRELVGAEPITPFFDILEGLEAWKSGLTEYENEFGTFSEALSNAFGGLASIIKSKLAGLLPSFGGGTTAPTTDTTFAPTAPLKQFNLGFDTGFGKDFAAQAAMTAAGMDLITRAMVNANINSGKAVKIGIELSRVVSSSLLDAFTSFGELLGNLFTGDGGARGFFKGILLIVAGFLSSLGKALIAAGVASEAFQKLFANPIAAIAAGIALIATAAIVRNLLKKGPTQGLRSGGFVTDGGVFQLHKDEMVSLPRGSAVTPARQVNGGGGVLTTKIALRSLIIELRREEQRMGRS